MNQSPTLNAGQLAAEADFLDFLVNLEERCIIIDGPGGVGKTFLQGHLIDNTIPKYMEMCSLLGMEAIYLGVDMTATTNKAAAVLGQATKRPTDTIQSFLGLVLKKDFTNGTSKLVPGKKWQIHTNKVIFIDESSFLDTHLLGLIDQATAGCKVVFVGDEYQLTPVGETTVPVYTRGHRVLRLTEPMRSGIPELLAVQDQLRQTVITGEFKPIKIVPGIVDWLTDEQFEQEIQQNFMQSSMDYKIIAYTNERVLQYNEHIHEMRGLDEPYVAGQYVVNNSNIELPGGRRLTVEQELLIKELTGEPDVYTIGGIDITFQPLLLWDPASGLECNVMAPVDKVHFRELTKYLAKKKMWYEFYSTTETYPDLRQRDAGTVHKAQGSTYHTIYIDAANLGKCYDPDEVARLLYVALTRPRFRACFYGALPIKYGGLVR